MNVIARLEFELTYFEGTVQNFSYYSSKIRLKGLVSLFNDISTFVGNLMPKPPL